MSYVRISFLSLILAMGTGCATNLETGQTELTGAGVGAVVGLVAGGVLGAVVGDHRAAYAGAALGAAIGGGIGYANDRSQSLKADLAGTGMQVSQVESKPGQQQVIVVSAPADITFKSGSADLNSSAYMGLSRMSEALRNAPGQSVEVVGHTDNSGSETLNQLLSQARAESVAAFLRASGVPANAITATGRSYFSPVAGNDTPEGRAMNRRVEIRITTSALTQHAANTYPMASANGGF